MIKDDIVINHYHKATLLDEILAACGTDTPTAEQLSAFDEFHVGRGEATAYLGVLMALSKGMRLLDAGCGAGGAARHMASRYGVHVTGIDLTPSFIDTAAALSDITGQADNTDFICGSVTDMPFETGEFDASYSIHVGMNIADKQSFYAEVKRCLKADGVFAVYDICGDQERMKFPMPWATKPVHSHVLSDGDVKALLQEAGFDVLFEENRRAFALDSLAKPRAMREAGKLEKAAPPVYMEDFAKKTSNLIDGLDDDVCSPWIFICKA